MRLMFFITILLSLVLASCSTKRQIEYRQVLVPVKCEIPDRQRPSRQSDVLETLKAILIYTNLLEKDLKICKGK